MLTGRTVTLRPWRAGDVEFFHELRNDLETQLALLALPRPNTMDVVQKWLSDRAAAEDGVFFVIAEAAKQSPLGFIELRSIQRMHSWALLGVCLAPQARGQGAGREALQLMEQYASQVQGLRKIVLQVLASNTAAVSLYQRAGYRLVGVHAEHFCSHNRRHDVNIMEKLLTPGGSA